MDNWLITGSVVTNKEECFFAFFVLGSFRIFGALISGHLGLKRKFPRNKKERGGSNGMHDTRNCLYMTREEKCPKERKKINSLTD